MTRGEDARFILTAASPKHYLVYNLEGQGPANLSGTCEADQGTFHGAKPYPDGGQSGKNGHVCRYSYNAEVSDRDLVEYYLPAWNAAVTRGGALGFMCSCVLVFLFHLFQLFLCLSVYIYSFVVLWYYYIFSSHVVVLFIFTCFNTRPLIT
jgi:hypothetical protein